MITPLVLLAVLQQPAAADTTAGRPCQVVIDTIGNYGRQVEVRPGETNFFGGGGVRAHCQGTGSTLAADSVAWYARVGRFDMVGSVKIRDTAIALDATTAAYFLRQERLEAHKDIVAENRATGSVLRGPNLTYLRVANGIRDTVEMYATSRPTVQYRATPDSGEPYLIVADRVRFKGNDRMWGGGKVTIDRSDFAAHGDSLALDQATGLALLVGRPQVEGKGARAYTLVGARIEMELREREVHLVKALGRGEATGADWRLTADTIHLVIDRRKLQQALAWGDSSRPHAISALSTIQADSLALDAPDEVLTEARAFGRALSTAKRDSAATTADQNWIAGDSLTARWAQEPDSSGIARTKLSRIVARGDARALTHLYTARDSSAGPTGPSLNYSRGARIVLALKGDRIDQVVVSGRADGLQLDPAPPPADTATKRARGTSP